MKRLLTFSCLVTFALFVFVFSVPAQEEARAAWQITRFDISTNIQQGERALGANVVVSAKNVGRASGSSFTFRISSKAVIKTIAVAGANASFRNVPEARSDLQRVTVTLPSAVAPGTDAAVIINYMVPVERNDGLAAISPIGSQFLPRAFWYPLINTPLTVRGADTAPFRLSTNAPNVISSGVEKPEPAGSSGYEQTLNGQPFLVQGDWDRVEGSGEGKGITAYLPKGVSADERKQAEAIIALAASARTFYAGALGPAPEAPIRLVAVRRGAGFNDAGTVLIETGAFRRAKIDSSTALLISEAVARIWIGGQTAARGEGSGLIRDGLVRFLSLLFLEKQFGQEAVQAELQRERLTYAGVARRDAPLSRTTPLDATYFSSVPNKGAMVWRLVDRKLGRDAFLTTVRSQVQAGKDDLNGISLASFRATLVERGGQSLKTLLDQQIDQVTDTDLMVGLPQQRGAEWVVALRNLGSIDVTVPVVATTDQGQQVSVEATMAARSLGDAVFKTSSRLVRIEVDPDKLYPQLDYANDVAPRGRDLADAMAEATRQFGAQDYGRAESIAREILATAPRMQEARIILARALLGENKLDEAEKLFRSALEDPLPTPATLAWAGIGLGEISLKRGQPAEAAKRFNDAVRTDAEYASSLAARAGRIKAETATGGAPPVDDSARAFIGQLDQAITSARKAELDSRVVSGELVRFVSGIIGTQPEIWQSRVLRTEQLDANLLAADIGVRAKELGQEQSGTAVFILSRSGAGWKLAGIELFEVR